MVNKGTNGVIRPILNYLKVDLLFELGGLQ